MKKNNMKKKHIKTDDYIEQILKSEPDFTLSSAFEKKLFKRIEKIVSWEAYLKQFMRWVAIGVFTLLVAVVALYFVNKEDLLLFFNFVLQHWAIVLTILFLTFFIAFFDIVLLNYAFYRYGKKK